MGQEGGFEQTEFRANPANCLGSSDSLEYTLYSLELRQRLASGLGDAQKLLDPPDTVTFQPVAKFESQNVI